MKKPLRSVSPRAPGHKMCPSGSLSVMPQRRFNVKGNLTRSFQSLTQVCIRVKPTAIDASEIVITTGCMEGQDEENPLTFLWFTEFPGPDDKHPGSYVPWSPRRVSHYTGSHSSHICLSPCFCSSCQPSPPLSPSLPVSPPPSLISSPCCCWVYDWASSFWTIYFLYFLRSARKDKHY